MSRAWQWDLLTLQDAHLTRSGQCNWCRIDRVDAEVVHTPKSMIQFDIRIRFTGITAKLYRLPVG